MKKAIFPILITFTALLFFSFRPQRVVEEKFTITVTADKQTHFDMLQDGDITKGLTTPYVLTVDPKKESKFIFKSENGSKGFRIDLEGMRSKLTANWPITVLVISSATVSTFGME
jgi:hypothetical protein